MSKEFLSQDEVDALLKGVTGETEADKPAENASGVRPYNLAKQERIVRGRMPTLELINERFARQLRVGLFNFVRRSAEISVGPVRVIKYGEFIHNLVVPTNLNLVQVKPLRGTSLFIFDPNLIFLVIDNLFGSDGRFHSRVEGREFTQTEQRIIQRLLEIVFEHYQKSWQPVSALSFEYVRSEMNTQFASIATPNEVVVTTTFTVELGSISGDFHICMPYGMLEPIRDMLYSSLQGEQMEVDKRWIRLLSKQVQLADVELVANLVQVPVTFAQILRMKPGDVITADISQTIPVEIDGVPVMECSYGVFNGQYALKVQRMLGATVTEISSGAQHVRVQQ